MKLAKTLFCGLLLAGMVSPLYAKEAASTISAAEMKTLATIAAIDKNEILVSVVASNKKTNAGIADFAKMMIDQHGGNLTQILEMVNAQALPSSNGEAEKLSMQGRKEMASLATLKGEQFDKAYVDAMVNGHQAALDLINKQLMQTAKSEEMKQFMTQTRDVVEQHLEHAKKLQAEMQSS